ncbi:hypothetical protein [Arachidicoccus soli]|uniref:hypothetical protein n=1 Tax=Arachidicoccus soli TaxID=2341117 RepID=UPI001F08DF59|nr:hypothetical protein [Arachidicoccus soli]
MAKNLPIKLSDELSELLLYTVSDGVVEIEISPSAVISSEQRNSNFNLQHSKFSRFEQ